MIHLFHQPACPDDQCDRHRALSGKDQRAVFLLILSSVITSVFATSGDSIMTPPTAKAIDVRSDVTRITLSMPDAPGSQDTIIDYIPRPKAFEDDPVATWRIDLYESSKVVIHGDREALDREFWTVYAQDNDICGEYGYYTWVRRSPVTDKTGVIWFSVMDLSRFVLVRSNGNVVAEGGDIDPDALAFWRHTGDLLKQRVAECQEAR